MIDVRTHERVMRVKLDRPEKKNALTAAMYEGLANALAQAQADAGVRAVVIHGQEDCFTAGNDLGDFMERPPRTEDAPVFRFIAALCRFPKPLVAAVAGPAVGIGTTMLLHCDLVYAAANARFALPFVTLGLVPEAGSSLLLPMLAGHQRAARVFLSGAPFSADEAHALGFVTEVVREGSVVERAAREAEAIARLPAEPVQRTKELLRRPYLEALERQVEEERKRFAQCLAAPPAREAMSAFLERRKPDFSRF